MPALHLEFQLGQCILSNPSCGSPVLREESKSTGPDFPLSFLKCRDVIEISWLGLFQSIVAVSVYVRPHSSIAPVYAGGTWQVQEDKLGRLENMRQTLE